jgi:hypothetical protein
MAWFYEILGENDEVVEASEPVYASAFEAQYGAYTRMKEKPSLFGPVPTTGWRDQGGLRTVMAAGPTVRAKYKQETDPPATT